MKRIFKYWLPSEGGETITINANVVAWLTVSEQNGWPCVWAIIDEEGESHSLEIIALGTGWEFYDELMYTSYLGTVQDGNGYVWHYFVREKEN